MIINACAISDIGSFRNKNEDNFYLSDEFVDGAQYKKTTLRNAESLICSVCDGMGGEHKGDLASKIAVNTLQENISGIINDKYSINSINDLYLKANRNVFLSNEHKNRIMGTTMSLLCIFNHSFIASNVGDTRIYHYTDGSLFQLSRDHTKEQLLIDIGLIIDKNSNDNHMLTQFIGIDSEEMIIEPYIVTGSINRNDMFLLCSDGLYDHIPNEDIIRIISANHNVDTVAQMLIDKAKNNGSNDNITVIVISVSKLR
ncbi:MAG: PP2C family protein-serine/threonine phosphatase [Eubacterium sp.]